MKHYNTVAELTKEFDAKSKLGLGAAHSCYRKLLDQILGNGLLWPKYYISEYNGSFVLAIGNTENGDETESFQILPEPLAPKPRLVITTPSTDTLVQHWPKSLTSTHYRCTRVVMTFSDLNKAFKAWIKYRTHMLDLKFTELRRQEVMINKELEIYKQYTIIDIMYATCKQ